MPCRRLSLWSSKTAASSPSWRKRTAICKFSPSFYVLQEPKIDQALISQLDLKSAAVYQSSQNKEDYVNKRMLLTTGLASLILLVASACALSARGWQAAPHGRAPHRFVPPGPAEKVRVAFVLTEGATMIDFAGPWEVFQDTMPIRTSDKMTMPFELFTVSGSKNPIHISGGMTVVPDYTFDDAPPARIVVVPAQRGDPKLADWLRRR